jgi:hypothetical protein
VVVLRILGKMGIEEQTVKDLREILVLVCEREIEVWLEKRSVKRQMKREHYQ